MVIWHWDASEEPVESTRGVYLPHVFTALGHFSWLPMQSQWGSCLMCIGWAPQQLYQLAVAHLYRKAAAWRAATQLNQGYATSRALVVQSLYGLWFVNTWLRVNTWIRVETNDVILVLSSWTSWPVWCYCLEVEVWLIWTLDICTLFL